MPRRDENERALSPPNSQTKCLFLPRGANNGRCLHGRKHKCTHLVKNIPGAFPTHRRSFFWPTCGTPRCRLPSTPPCTPPSRPMPSVGFRRWPSAYGSAWLAKEYARRGGQYASPRGASRSGSREWLAEWLAEWARGVARGVARGEARGVAHGVARGVPATAWARWMRERWVQVGPWLDSGAGGAVRRRGPRRGAPAAPLRRGEQAHAADAARARAQARQVQAALPRAAQVEAHARGASTGLRRGSPRGASAERHRPRG